MWGDKGKDTVVPVCVEEWKGNPLGAVTQAEQVPVDGDGEEAVWGQVEGTDLPSHFPQVSIVW